MFFSFSPQILQTEISYSIVFQTVGFQTTQSGMFFNKLVNHPLHVIQLTPLYLYNFVRFFNIKKAKIVCFSNAKIHFFNRII